MLRLVKVNGICGKALYLNPLFVTFAHEEMFGGLAGTKIGIAGRNPYYSKDSVDEILKALGVPDLNEH